MSGVVRRLPVARREILGIYANLAVSSDELADRFLISVEETIERVSSMPGIGAPWESKHPQLAGIRCVSVDDFPNHLIFYRPIDGGIELLRVIHGKRELPRVLGEDP